MLFQDSQAGTWKVWNLTSLTQKWINGTAANNGVILWATNEDTEAHDLRFYSRENATNQPKLVVTWSNTPKTIYFLKDHLGSTRTTVDQTGAVVGYDDYDPWGYALAGRTQATQWSASQSVAENKFTGKERDDDFGINWDYFGARYYDAQIGRWMARDPLARKHSSFTPYQYARNNPIFYVDPDGKEDKWHMLVALGRGVGGAAIFGGGIAAMIKGGTLAPFTLGGSLPLVVGGMASTAFGAHEFAAATLDYKVAAATPDGMNAEVFGNLIENIAREAGAGEGASEVLGLVADILLNGGKDIPENLSSGKLLDFVQAVADAGQLTEDIEQVLMAWVKQTKAKNDSPKDEKRLSDAENKTPQKKSKKNQDDLPRDENGLFRADQ